MQSMSRKDPSGKSGGKPELADVIAAGRYSLARWLRAGRFAKGLSIEDVARITKIPARTLDKLETGDHAGLPADVFVKGFVRNFARAVGLDESESLARYSVCGAGAATMASAAARALIDSMADLAPQTASAAGVSPLQIVHAPKMAEARVDNASPHVGPDVQQQLPDEGVLAVAVEAMADIDSDGTVMLPSLADGSSKIVVADIAQALHDLPTAQVFAAEPAQDPSFHTTGKPKRKRVAKGTIVPDLIALDSKPAAKPDAKPKRKSKKTIVPQAADDQGVPLVNPPVASELSAATMPPADVTNALPEIDHAAAFAALQLHDLGNASAEVIENVEVDASPSELTASVLGDLELGDVWVPTMPAAPIASKRPQVTAIPWQRPTKARALPVVPTLVIDDSDPESAERALEQKSAQKPRRSLIPSILLENDDRARQGGLTLAVIILLIAATLTLSYLMRRPGSGGDGMTSIDTDIHFTSNSTATSG
jgi:transcriptional regulator with XRE-family HTH domain